jgi:hypothetical protein
MLKRGILLVILLVITAFQPCLVKGSENLIPNGSFEVGSWGWTPVEWIESALRDGLAFNGEYYLHLTSPHPYGNDWKYNKIQSQYFLIEEGEHTLSFYARGSKRGLRLHAAVISGYRERKGDRPHSINERFILSRNWKQYHLRGVLKKQGQGAYLVEFRIPESQDDSIWIDGISVHKGSPAYFRPRHLEAAVYVEQNGYFTKGQEVRFQAFISLDRLMDNRLQVSYSLYDYYERRIGQWNKHLPIHASTRNLEDNVSWKADRYGIFRMLFEVTGTRREILGKAETIFAVLPEFNGGLSENSPFGTHFAIYPTMVDIARRLGVKWVRLHDLEDFTNWFRAEPEEGNFAWFDDRVDLALAHGINILGVIEKPPYWASRGKPRKADPIHSFMGYPPADLKDFWRYVHSLVSHYRGKIKYWEIWNEPYNNAFWNGTKERFVELMRTAYDAAKAADPQCVIVAPAGRYEFIEDIFELGAYDFLDILSYHQYFENTESWNSLATEAELVKKLKKLMGKYGEEKPIWNTEGGVISKSFYTCLLGGGTQQLRDFRFSNMYDHKRPAELIVKWYVMNFLEGVDKCFCYYMREDGVGYFGEREAYQSLLEYNRKPKPHAVAMAILADILGPDLKRVDRIEKRIAGSYLRIFLFQTSKKPLVVLWWGGRRDNEKGFRIPFKSDELEIKDLMGNLAPGGGFGQYTNLPLQQEPIYLAFKTETDLEVIISLLREAAYEYPDLEE